MYDTLLRFDKKSNILFLDTETCNLCLHQCHNLCWQIGLINTQGGNITKEQDLLVKYPFPIKLSEGAMRINHYSQAKVDMYGVTPQVAWERTDKALKEADWIIGHNFIGFDVYILSSFYHHVGKELDFSILKKMIDTYCLAKGLKMGVPYKTGEDLVLYMYRVFHKKSKVRGCSLGALGKEANIEHDYTTLHDAMSDLRLNVKYWNHLKFQVEI